jgi:hypothetical protein
MGRDRPLHAGFAVEVAVEVIILTIIRRLRITRNPYFYLVAGAGFEPATFGSRVSHLTTVIY